MSSVFVVSIKEMLDLRRDRLLGILIAFLAASILISVVVAAADFRTQLDAYNLYVETLRQSGNTVIPAAPQLFPLQLLRGGIEYLEILGALFAIVLGYGTIAKEKYRGTLQILLSRPLGRYSFAGGKLIGLSLIWLIVVAMLTLVSTLALLIVGNAPLQGIDIARVVIAAGFAWLYLVFWSALAVGLTALSSRLSTGLIIALVIWLAFVLIVPQIGDTMDPDNQVPGGLFATLQIQKPDEVAVLARFAGFDAIRNGLEVSSITKHFERIAFGFLGIKDKYNQQPLGFVFSEMLPYIITLIGATLASLTFAAAVTTRHNPAKESLMKWKIIIPAALVVLLGVGAVGVSQLNTQPQAAAPGQAASSTASTVLPVTANPIKNTSTTPGLTIVSAAAENNVDSTGATLNDRLQVVLKNSTDKPLTTFEIYYTMTDKTTGASEAYYLPLTGLTLAAKSETTVSFVNQAGAGNYPENKFSLYRNSPNQVDFAIEVSAAGVQIAKGTAMKSVGTGEKGD